MDPSNLFAQMPTTPEPIIAQVCRHLQADALVTAVVGAAELEQLAEAAVRVLWDNPVKAFVPVLALRAVREHLATAGLATRTSVGEDDPAASRAVRGSGD